MTTPDTDSADSTTRLTALIRKSAVAALVVGALAVVAARGASAQVIPGAIIGDDNSTAIGNAPAMWKELAKPVGLVETAKGCGTAFLIGDDCMLTCAHVVEGEDLESIKIWFDYEDKTAPYERHRSDCGTADSALSTPDKWTVASVTILSSEEDLDCALIKVAKKDGEFPGEVYGHVTVRLTEPTVIERVHVIHHADAGGKEYSHDGDSKVYDPDDRDCHSLGRPGWFSHGADAENGASGAPVFDKNGCVIGKHCASVTIEGNTKNCAVKMNAVAAAVEAQGCLLDVWAATPTEPKTWGQVKSLYR